MLFRCDEFLLELLLSGRLDDVRAQYVESHLEGCSLCRTRLDELAADGGDWQEVIEQLSDVGEGSGLASIVKPQQFLAHRP